VVLLHGGFWRAEYDLTLMLPLAHDLARHGVASCSLEYRRRTPGERGVADASVADVLAGWAACAAHRLVRPDRMAVVGHSAGGTLALLVAARAPIPPLLALAQAAVTDLRAADHEALSDGGDAVRKWVGIGPGEAPERWRAVDPCVWRPRCPVVMAHGRADRDVPASQCERYLAAHAEAPGLRSLSLPGDHYAIIDPGAQDWRPQRALILEALCETVTTTR
jgi:dipeptidyl aminopeptidase/acylaminoacyl peptidase